MAHDLHDTSKFYTWESWLIIHVFTVYIHIWCHHVTRILEAPSCDFRNLWNFVKLSAWLSHISLLFVGTWTLDSNSRNSVATLLLEIKERNKYKTTPCLGLLCINFAGASPNCAAVVEATGRLPRKALEIFTTNLFPPCSCYAGQSSGKTGEGGCMNLISGYDMPIHCLHIGKMLVPLGWYPDPSCLSPQRAL